MHERLSVLDASFLYLERPNVHMHVAGVAVLDPSTRADGRLGVEHIEALIADRIHLVPRFRQKAVFPPFGVGRPMWVEDEDFDVRFHLRRAALPAPGGRRELAELVQRVHSRQLDRSKPLWEMYLVEGLEDDLVAVLVKSHHAMIDGLSGMDIATVLVDFTPEPQPVRPPGPWRPEPEPDRAELLAEGVVATIARPIEAFLERIAWAAASPAEAVRRAVGLLGGLGDLARLGQATPGPFSGRTGPNRRFAIAEVPVADAKSVKDALGGTVNDVVLAAVTGALRRLIRRRGEPTEGLELRAMIPVSTRDSSERMALGNKVSVFFADLPVDVAEPAGRLHRITRETGELKSSHQAVAAWALINTAQWTPPTLHALAARLIGGQRVAHLVVSNVPGPQVPLYLGGARIIVAYPVMPIGERMGLSVAVTSLTGTMGFGFTGDWDALPDIEFLAEALVEEVEELKKAAGA